MLIGGRLTCSIGHIFLENLRLKPEALVRLLSPADDACSLLVSLSEFASYGRRLFHRETASDHSVESSVEQSDRSPHRRIDCV